MKAVQYFSTLSSKPQIGNRGFDLDQSDGGRPAISDNLIYIKSASAPIPYHAPSAI